MNQKKQKNDTVKRLLRYIGADKKRLLVVFCCILIGNISLLIAPKLIGRVIDAILAESSWIGTLICILALYLVGALFLWLSSRLAIRVSNAVVASLRKALFQKLEKLPISYFDRTPHGDIISRFSNDIEAVGDGINSSVVQLISGVSSILISLGFMLSLDARVTVVVLVTTPLCYFVGRAITRYGKKRFREQAKLLGDVNAYTEEYISGAHTVKIFSHERRSVQEFAKLNQKLYDVGYRAQFASALVNPTTRFVNNIAYVLVGIFALLVRMTPGNIAAFLSYMSQFSKPFNEITSITMQIQSAMASARRIFELLDEPEMVPDGTVQPATPSKGEISFRDVCFSYVPEKSLIEHFHMDIPAGTQVAIVGPTGAGKTTIVNLLMRFYELNSGEIRIDGKNIADMPRDALREQFGMVLQETWLFAGTVRENLLFAKPDATDEEMIAAAKAAHAHHFIERLPNGYETFIEEDGSNLSAGQKQLLTIVRVMLANRPMLILDEATSNVDIVTEMQISKTFREIMKGKTTFIIAHRLSTIRECSIILVLDRGHVVEYGTHEQLLSNHSVYEKLYLSQFRHDET